MPEPGPGYPARRMSPRKRTGTTGASEGFGSGSSAMGSGSVSLGRRKAELETEGTRGMRNRPLRGPMPGVHDHDNDDQSSDDDLPDLATLLGTQKATLRARSRNPTRREGETRREALPPSRDSKTNPKTGGSLRIKPRPRYSGLQEPDSLISSSSSRPLPATKANSGTGLLQTPSLPPPSGTVLLPPLSKVIEDRTETTTTTRSSRQQIQRRRSPIRAGDGVSPIKQSNTSTLSPTKKINPRFEAEHSQSTYLGSRNKNANASKHSLKLTHVNSLLLPLRDLALGSESEEKSTHSEDDRHGISTGKPMKAVSRRGLESRKSRERERSAKYILKDAVCKDDDDEEEEEEDDEEEEFTDLSGFIVDDDADISFCDSDSGDGSGFDSDEEQEEEEQRKSPAKRRLVRGIKEARRSLSDELQRLKLEWDDEDCKSKSKSKRGEASADSLADAVTGMNLGVEDRKPHLSKGRTGELEVVDLTSSPVNPQAEKFPAQSGDMPKRRRHVQLGSQRSDTGIQKNQSDSESSSDHRDALLRFSPPTRKSPLKIESKVRTIPLHETNLNSLDPENAEPTTPPQTPPASPSKLQSPSKLKSPSKNLLLSPSKRGIQIPESPHRQSIDAFWSSEVINEWNDQYSPKKPPLTISPKKRWKIWEDDSDSGSESPCESPARRIASPEKKATSPVKKAAADKKKAAATAKKRFDDEKISLAHDLLKELDGKVSNGKLAQLSQSTGGVKIIWSKNLRSTAGRANWRRTVTKTSTGSPVKENPGRIMVEAGDVKVQHYASIELAEKVIDNEERLVNTLAHEYCHLANFMVSGIRDQPHGASFKRWAQKVTSTFRTHPKENYRRVEVTTKHSYEINHKYLWVCVGTPPNAAKDFLNLPDDDGCGAEYGRHSKSIDPEKHRCGKCKGVLVQVRPKPRKVDPSKKGRSPFKKKGNALENLQEAMELVTIDED